MTLSTPASRLMTIVCLCLSGPVWATSDVALVTSLQGKVSRAGGDAPVVIDSFVKLKQGDLLTLEKDAKIQITYFENGRQESWTGAGKLEVVTFESKGNGLASPKLKQVPMVIVKQLARTPSLDSQGRAGVMRLRSIPTPAAVAKVEDTYKHMRAGAGSDDLNPELYLMAGLLELRELDRLEVVLGEMDTLQKSNNEAKLLISLYRKALSSARQSK